jgi:outer membrane protein assembly factor BamE (lipoprotein component of BamABCDE complex)
MPRSLPTCALLISLAQALAACESARLLTSDQTQSLLSGPIRVGMSREDVVGLLGPPHRQERHGVAEFLFYDTVWQASDRAAARMPIALIDGKVVGLGKAHYDRIVEAGRRGWGIDLAKQ